MITQYRPNDHSHPRVHRLFSIDPGRDDYDEDVVVYWSYTERVSALRPLMHRNGSPTPPDRTSLLRSLLRELVRPHASITHRVDAFRAAQWRRPMIGVHGPNVAQLRDAQFVKKLKTPVAPPGPTTAASRAEPAFEFGDRIVGSSFDPRDPKQVKPLPIDPRPRIDGKQWPDYYEFQRRLIDLAVAATLLGIAARLLLGE